MHFAWEHKKNSILWSTTRGKNEQIWQLVFLHQTWPIGCKTLIHRLLLLPLWLKHHFNIIVFCHCMTEIRLIRLQNLTIFCHLKCSLSYSPKWKVFFPPGERKLRSYCRRKNHVFGLLNYPAFCDVKRNRNTFCSHIKTTFQHFLHSVLTFPRFFKTNEKLLEKC